jgi:oligopeptide/dipeptide ABC transporter ATP-binding protein
VSRKGRIVLTGDLPDPANPPGGCAFHTRCPRAMDICRTSRPELEGGAHATACHLPEARP